MGRTSEFFRPARFDYLGAVDRDWIERTAKYYNLVNPPTLPLDYSRIRARENILIAQMYNENKQYAKNAYSLSYLKSIPDSIVAGLAGPKDFQRVSELPYNVMFDRSVKPDYVVDAAIAPYLEAENAWYAKFQTEMGRIVNQALFSFLNETDQSIWYEWLLRMDRGAANDRDMFLGVFDRGSVIDFARVVNVVAASAIILYGGWTVAAAVSGGGAAGGAAAGAGGAGTTAGGVAASTELTALATTTEAGGLLGGTGLLSGSSAVVAETSLVGTLGSTAGITVAEYGATAASGGLLASIGSAAQAAATAAIPSLLDEGKKAVENLLNPKKDIVIETPSISSEDAFTFKKVAVGAGLVGAIIYLLT